MNINNQEILRMLEYHGRSKELSALTQLRQYLIRQIMDLLNPGKTKDLITIARDFKELVKLNEDELKLRYLSKKYPDFEHSLEDGDIHTVLKSYKGKTLPDFPPGLKYLYIWDCENIEALPEFPSSLKDLEITNCPNLTQETLDRIKEFNKKQS